jgi:hypothetical protein
MVQLRMENEHLKDKNQGLFSKVAEKQFETSKGQNEVIDNV